MTAFREHHADSIRFGDRCFDRLLLNGLIQPFQQPERVVRFFTRYRDHRVCVVFPKLFERIYAPLTAGLLQPFHGDAGVQEAKRHQLDRLYHRVVDHLDRLLDAVGLKVAA